MENLYSRLSEVGLRSSFIRRQVLPEWWAPELESQPAAVAEAAGYIAIRCGLDVASVFKPDSPIIFKYRGIPQAKKTDGTTESVPLIAQGLAANVAEMVAYTCQPEYQPLPDSALEIRSLILKHNYCVYLDSLLQFCWSYGVGVVYFSRFPQNVEKIAGMVGYFYDRPAIVLSAKQFFSAELLFILAHQLRHLTFSLRDCESGTIIADKKVDRDSGDNVEADANTYAYELLLGKSDIRYQAPRHCNAIALAELAIKSGKREGVDPGFIALNYSWEKRRHVGCISLLSSSPRCLGDVRYAVRIARAEHIGSSANTMSPG